MRAGRTWTAVAMAATATLVVGLGAAPAPASSAPAPPAPDPIATGIDERGDVRFTGATGLPKAKRRWVDLHRVDVGAVPGAVRFAVEIKRVARQAPFDQMVFIELRPPVGSAERWRGSMGFAAQQPDLAYAYLFQHGARPDATCDPLTSVALGGRDEIRLDVPTRCLPTTEARIAVRTLSGYFRSDARTWSKDKLRLAGTHLLR